VLTEADDRLHPPVTDDPWWTETAWFGFAVPDEGLCGSIYQLYRPNQGVMMAGVYVWAPGRDDLWELPYYRTYWHLPIPEGAHPLACELATGLTVSTLHPMRSYRLTYTDGDELRLDLTFDAIQPAQPFHVSGGMGHLDQLGRVRGEMTLHGRTVAVDCFEMRDRSWTPRRETSARTRRGYTYGTADERTAFYVATSVGADGVDTVLGGYVLDGGSIVPVTAGRREVRRDERLRPIAVDLDLVDERGRRHELHGDIASRLALPTTPYFAWMSLARWRSADGWEGWGEDHDSWSPALLRRFRREAVS
jgi:hypothetical protein